MKKVWMMLMTLLLVIGISGTPVRADDPATPEKPQRDCTPEEEYTGYSFATPDYFMPDVETTNTTIVWNYQCTHEENSVEVFDSNGNVVNVIQSGGGYSKGENRIAWEGRDDSGQPVKDGVYTVVVTPLDEYAMFAMRVNVKIRLMKYPAIYGIFGDELKEKVKSLP